MTATPTDRHRAAHAVSSKQREQTVGFGNSSHCRHCRSAAAPPSRLGRRFNRDRERVSAELQNRNVLNVLGDRPVLVVRLQVHRRHEGRGRDVRRGSTSRRREFCHSHVTPLSSLLIHLLKVKGGAAKMTVSPTARINASLTGACSRRRDCHSAAPPSTFSRRTNRDGEGVSAK